MVPIALDPTVLVMAVAGRGDAVLRRFRALRAGGAADLSLFSDQPEGLDVGAGEALRRRLPGPADLQCLRVLWIAGLPRDDAAELAAAARALGVLVNVEDRPELCDFHNVAEVRRGDLLLTVSTGGSSPGLAARIRARLAAEFGAEWSGRLDVLRRHRMEWRAQGRDVADLTNALLRANGWLA
jgi:precorrin-2 dehydrogenase/sirohydrochlorin ferrochelatase